MPNHHGVKNANMDLSAPELFRWSYGGNVWRLTMQDGLPRLEQRLGEHGDKWCMCAVNYEQAAMLEGFKKLAERTERAERAILALKGEVWPKQKVGANRG